MRQYVQMGMAGVLFLMISITRTCDSKQRAPQSELVLAAIVENIGKDPGVSSGYYTIYQLAKYRVVSVCTGSYERKEIVVDHLLVSGDELKSLRVGDKVYLTLHPSKTIAMRFDEEGFRGSSQNVETFYIGHKPDIIKPPECKD